MTWTVYYRDKTGSKVSILVDAESRSELFKILAEKKINAIRVVEGAEKASQKKRSNGSGLSKKTVNTLLTAFVAMLVIGTLGYLFLYSHSEKKPTPSVKVNTPKIDKPKVTPKTEKVESTNIATNVPAPKKDVLKPGNITTNQYGQEVRVNKDGSRVAISTAWARRLKEQKENPPKRVFKHIAEGYLAMFLNPAVSVPPPPDVFTDDDVRRMLETKIEIDPANDTEDEIRQKEGVIAMKEELTNWLNEGRTFQSYLTELQKRQDHEAAEMQEARRMITESLEKGDLEDARAVYDKINEYFKGKHMPKVNVAPKYRRLLEERNQ